MRALSLGMALVAVVQLQAGAAPGELLTTAAPALTSAQPKATSLNAGDASVSTQTGALQYSYPIHVPPGRHGMQPALSLSYSSQAPIYGGIAAGWQLPIPIISLDTSNGRLVGPKTYASSMGGGRPLVAVTETLPAGTDAAYRAQNDATFTRYLHQAPNPTAHWIAQTTDGVTYYFGDTAHTAGCIISDDYAPLTTMIDAFGNAVDYYYEAGVPGECRISRISWGENGNYLEFARVTFVYAVSGPACHGVPVGSDISYRSGIQRVSGASQLSSLSITAFEPGQSGAPKHTRTIALAYNDNDASCMNKYAPYRSLKSITESAGITGDPVVSLPAVTFSYGDPTPASTPTKTAVPWHNAWGGANLYGALMWGQRFKTSGQWPTVEAMMVDVDGDGLLDRLTNDSFDGSQTAHCGASWERNLGPGRGFDSTYRHIKLPTLKWASTGFGGGTYAGSNGNTDEVCALNYQQTDYVNSTFVNGVDVGCAGAACPIVGGMKTYCGGAMYGMDCGPVGGRSPTILAYRWIDVDDDGKVDLVASIAQGGEGVYNLSRGNMAGAPAEPAIFGAYPTCPSTAYNDGNTTTNNYTMCHGMYPWFVYLNRGGTFGSVPDRILYQPSPLETTYGDSSVTGPVTGQFEGNFDLDGDGHGDVATAASTWSIFRGIRDLAANQQTAFQPSVAFGAGSADTTISQTSLVVYGVSQPVSTSGLIDLNGDGLPDHWSGSSSNVNVEMNNGVSFVQVPNVSARRPGNDSLTLHTDAFGATCSYAGSFANDCARVDVSRTADVDSDGRVDLVQLSGHCSSNGSGCVTNADCSSGTCVGGSVTPQVFYNVGGQFASSSVVAGDSVALTHHMDVSSKLLQGPGFGVNSFTWEVRSDMIDLDGDGIAEGVDFATDGTFYVSKVPSAPRLLVSINNGHGAITTASYLALSDTTAVAQNPATAEASPRTQWVVRAITTVDEYDRLGFGSTTSSTNDYQNPVYGLDDRGHFGFRGFEQTTTTNELGAKSVHRYDYSVDWRGVESQSLQFSAETPGDPTRIDLTSWEKHTLFSTAVTTFHPVSSKHYICGPAQTETACLAGPAGYSQSSTTMTACRNGGCDKSSSLASDSVAWIPTQTLEQMGTAPADGDRRSTSTYYVMAPPGTLDFRIRSLSSTKESQVSGTFTMFAKSAQTWDSTYRVPLTDEHWVDGLDSDRAISKTAYDMSTGNPTQHWKPKQNAASGSSETFDYDTRKLFVKADHSELGGYYNLSQERDYQYEYGTGTKIDTQGPNVAACSGAYPYTNPTCPAGTQYMQETKLEIDGLGRTLERWETQGQSSASAYTLLEREIDTYDPSLLLVTTQVAIDVDPIQRFTMTQAYLDGHGRPLQTIEVLTTAPVNAVTTYVYDAFGRLALVTVPDPSLNDGTTVSYAYTFDSLGRPLSIRRPDSSTSPSGSDISYSGLTTTQTDVVGAAGGQAGSTTSLRDVYGRVIKVDEIISGTTKATTSYSYDPADNVNNVVDPTGVTVTMEHDFLGRRTQVTRGPNTWQFSYDLNGNVIAETFPGSTSTDPNFIDTTTYDDLDRPNGRTIGQRTLSTADQATFGASYEWMLWDLGTNNVGQLGALYSYAPGASMPTTSSQYAHDLDGREGSTVEQFSGISTARSTQRLFTLGGGVSDYYYYEYPRSGGVDGSYAKYHYDDRGLPSSIDVSTQVGGTSQTIGVQTRNVAGLVTKRHTDNSVGPMTFVESNWSYDKLGRVASQVVQEGPGPTQVARQDLAYFGTDEPSTLDQWLGATNHKEFSYGYDQRHELTSVQETLLPNAFTASYSYNDAGRFLTAVESAAALPNSDVTARNVGYHYDGADPEQVTSLVDSTTSAVTWSYAYDATGNQTLRCSGAIVSGVCSGPSATQYTYDGNDRLRRAINFAGTTNQGGEEYFYDSHGSRYIIVKLDGSGSTTETIWFIGDVEAHYDGSGNWVHSYANYSMGTPVARLDTDSTLVPKLEFQFHGLANSTLAAVASDSTINASFTYAPFGEIVEGTNGGGTVGIGAHRRRLNDKYEDEATGLSYYGLRYYDHVSMVWTQADPLYQLVPDASTFTSPRRAKTYQFSLNNPLQYADPDGADSQPYLHSAAVPEDPATLAMAVEGANEHEDDDLIRFGRIVFDSDTSWMPNLGEPPPGSVSEDEDPRTETATPEEIIEDIFGPNLTEPEPEPSNPTLSAEAQGLNPITWKPWIPPVFPDTPERSDTEGFDNTWLDGESGPVKPGDCDTYGGLKARKADFGETEPMHMDHQPSYAAQKLAAERILGRPLTGSEARELRQSTPAVASPVEVHQGTSPTFGGRNSPARIGEDAGNLGAAQARDRSVFDEAMRSR